MIVEKCSSLKVLKIQLIYSTRTGCLNYATAWRFQYVTSTW